MTSCHHLSLPSFHGTSLRLAADLWSRTTTCFTACPSFSVRSSASSTMVCRQVQKSCTGGSCTCMMTYENKSYSVLPPVNPRSKDVDIQGYLCTTVAERILQLCVQTKSTLPTVCNLLLWCCFAMQCKTVVGSLHDCMTVLGRICTFIEASSSMQIVRVRLF